jgi:hypothetical protein
MSSLVKERLLGCLDCTHRICFSVSERERVCGCGVMRGQFAAYLVLVQPALISLGRRHMTMRRI